MARKRKSYRRRSRSVSLESKAKGLLSKAMPVVVGISLVGLGIRYFGNQPVVSDVAAGLNGSVKGTGFLSGWFG